LLILSNDLFQQQVQDENQVVFFFEVHLSMKI
jgi:hypothetical protein